MVVPVITILTRLRSIRVHRPMRNHNRCQGRPRRLLTLRPHRVRIRVDIRTTDLQLDQGKAVVYRVVVEEEVEEEAQCSGWVVLVVVVVARHRRQVM